MKRYVEYILKNYKDDEKTIILQLIDNPDSLDSKIAVFRKLGKRELNENVNMRELWDRAFEQFSKKCDMPENELCADIYASMVLYGCLPEEYFQFDFDKKSDSERMEYMCDKERFVAFRPFYDFEQYEKIRNKWLQYLEIGEYWNHKCLLCDLTTNNEEGFEQYCRFVEKNPSYIFKPIRECCGHGVVKVNIEGKNLRELYRSHCENYGGGIVDECIVQTDDFSSLHPQSVNAVRLIAIRSKSGETHFLEPMLRMGTGTEVIDNGDASIRAMADLKTGIVYSTGRDGYGNEFSVHPDTETQIVGFQIPNVEEMIQIADKVMKKIEDYARYVGFDMVHTKKGWGIIEINPFPQVFMQQMLMKKGSRKLLYQMIKESNL